MKKLAIILAVLLCASPLWAAPTLVDTCSGSTNTSTSYTAANCTVSGSNTYIACYAGTGRSATTVTSVTWDAAGANEALAAITNTSNTNLNRVWAGWFGLKNPTAGTNKSVTATPSGTGVASSIHCLMYSGVDQTTPTSGGTTSNTDGASASISVTSAAGDLVVAGLIVNNEASSTDFAVGAGETQETTKTLTTRATADENIHELLISEAGAASVTIAPTWTNSASQVLSGFSLKAAATTRPIAPFIFQ